MTWVDFVVCDDIRFEVKNKVTLVGVYGDSVYFETGNPEGLKWPVGLRMGFYLRLRLAKEEMLPIDGAHFEFHVFHNRNSVVKMGGQIGQRDDIASRAIAIPLVAGIPIAGPGALTFRLTIRNGDQVLFDDESPLGLSVLVRQIH